MPKYWFLSQFFKIMYLNQDIEIIVFPPFVYFYMSKDEITNKSEAQPIRRTNEHCQILGVNDIVQKS